MSRRSTSSVKVSCLTARSAQMTTVSAGLSPLVAAVRVLNRRARRLPRTDLVSLLPDRAPDDRPWAEAHLSWWQIDGFDSCECKVATELVRAPV